MPRRTGSVGGVLVCATALAATALGAPGAHAAPSGPIACPQAFPADQAADGVAATGWTVSKGTTPERFTARLLGRIDDALDVRPKGRLTDRALSSLPVVGLAGGHFAEREGLRRAAARAADVLEGVVRA